MLGNNLICIILAAATTGAALTHPVLEARATVSKDGLCGGTVTCQGSKFGNCCSQYGYCGSSDAYCGTGCKSDFGTCSSAKSPASKSATSSKTSATTSAAPVATSATADASSSTSTSASPYRVCTGTQLVQNPSFEDGLTSWSMSGGTVLQKNGDWKNQVASSGTNFAKLVVDSTNAQSALWQNVVVDYGARVTISYDWSLLVTTTGTRPPTGDCTLEVTWNSAAIAFWDRFASATGAGHVEMSFEASGSGGDLAFTFACTNPVYSAGLLIDNVQVKTC